MGGQLPSRDVGEGSRLEVTTAALHGRMSDHAYALREIGIGFEETDDHNAERIHGVGLRSNSGSVWGRLV
jgi:hypothetical protein